MQSTYALLGVPSEIGVLLFSFGFLLSLTPILAGADFGFLKVPVIRRGRRRRFSAAGVGVLVLSSLMFVPVWRAPAETSSSPAPATATTALSPAPTSEEPPPNVTSSSHLAIEYLRLFGAYQVPWMLDMMESGEPYTGDTAVDFSKLCRGNRPGGRDPLCLAPLLRSSTSAMRLAQWWANWPEHDALLFASHVGSGVYHPDRDVFSNEWVTGLGYYPFYFVWIACADDRRCRRTMIQYHTWLSEGYYMEYADDGSDLPEEAHTMRQVLADPDGVQQMVDRVSSRIGFLFLLIRNDSDTRLEDVRLEYAWYPLPEHSFPVGFDVSLDTINPLAGLPTPEGVEQVIRASEIQTNSVANFMPGKKILWLLSIYQRDAQGFPLRYASSVIRPVRLSYRVPGREQRTVLEIRAPLENQVVRDYLPVEPGLWMGWRGQ